MAFTFKLEHEDRTPADPPVLNSSSSPSSKRTICKSGDCAISTATPGTSPPRDQPDRFASTRRGSATNQSSPFNTTRPPSRPSRMHPRARTFGRRVCGRGSSRRCSIDRRSTRARSGRRRSVSAMPTAKRMMAAYAFHHTGALTGKKAGVGMSGVGRWLATSRTTRKEASHAAPATAAPRTTAAQTSRAVLTPGILRRARSWLGFVRLRRKRPPGSFRGRVRA